MSWYQATINLDGIRNKFSTDASCVFFDDRPLKALHNALWTDGCIEVERAALEPLIESRGMAILRDPHVVAIEQRLDLDMMAPDGPMKFHMIAVPNARLAVLVQ